MNAPLGANALALLAQLEADAEARVLTRLSAKDEVVVLHPMEGAQIQISHCDTTTRIKLSDERGACVRVWRHWQEPQSWRDCSYMAGVWHPAIWQGQVTLMDAEGRRWEHGLPNMVMDDFGSLVPAGPRA